jgi:hypothetical protein
MKLSTMSRAASSENCTGGDFMKYALGPISGPPIPRSFASLAQRTASITTPAELGESQTSSFISTEIGTSPKLRPSRRIIAHLRSSSHGTWSEGPMWIESFSSGTSSWDCTDWVFEIFFEVSRERSSMFMKSMLPPKFSW